MAAIRTTTLGGSAKDVVVAKVGVCRSMSSTQSTSSERDPQTGLMLLTYVDLRQPVNRTYVAMRRWTHAVVPDEVAFEAIKAAIDTVPTGCKMLLNSGTSIYHNSHPWMV